MIQNHWSRGVTKGVFKFGFIFLVFILGFVYLMYDEVKHVIVPL